MPVDRGSNSCACVISRGRRAGQQLCVFHLLGEGGGATAARVSSPGGGGQGNSCACVISWGAGGWGAGQQLCVCHLLGEGGGATAVRVSSPGGGGRGNSCACVISWGRGRGNSCACVISWKRGAGQQLCVCRGTVAQSVERATAGEEVPGSIPAVTARSLLVGSVSV